MFLVRRPSARDVERFLSDSQDLPLSYSPVGLASRPSPDFTSDEQVAVVGSGDGAFVRATAALSEWRHFDLGWVELFPRKAPIVPGTVIAVLIRHLGFWSLNGGRILYQLAGTAGAEFGFAYGTLTNHAESGEEIFSVRLEPATGNVLYTLRAASRPRAPLARLGYPVARVLQARFRRDSATAMKGAVADGM